MARARNSEHAEQVALFKWAEFAAARWPELTLMHAIPNGGHRNKITAARLKAEGVRAGVPDICLPVARGGWHGLVHRDEDANRAASRRTNAAGLPPCERRPTAPKSAADGSRREG